MLSIAQFCYSRRGSLDIHTYKVSENVSDPSESARALIGYFIFSKFLDLHGPGYLLILRVKIMVILCF